MDEQRELAVAMLEKVKNNEHQKWEFITNTGMCKATKIYRNAMRKIAKSFRDQSRCFFLKYVESVSSGRGNIQLLLSCRDFKYCAKFYEDEAAICDDMLDEFRSYFWCNEHPFTIGLLGMERAEDDLVDYRKLPWKIF